MLIRVSVILFCIVALAGCGADEGSPLPTAADASVGYDSSAPQDATAVWDSTVGTQDASAGDTSAADTIAGVDGDIGVNNCPPVTGEFVPGDPLVIPTREGPVVGVLNEGVRSWLGIPFAAPPEGERRFAPPAGPACRTSPLVASRFRSVCPQISETGEVVGAEDCLTLNIWAPVDTPDPLPVLVFIHGGAHMQGSASVPIAAGQPLYDGRFLAAQGPAVVVTIQYRLGALGWLVHPSFIDAAGVALANRGLLDQQQALRWIATHISGFGGDPARVTLFGESAGAVDTGLHLALEDSRELISGAIIQSGAPSAKSLATALVDGQRLVSAAGCDEYPVDCLRAMEVTALVKALPGDFRLDEASLGGGGSSYGPVIDGELITEDPVAMIASARDDGTSDIPVIIGTNSEEMASLLVLPVPNATTYAEAIALYIAGPLAVVSGGDKTSITARILELYPVDAYPTPREAIVDVYTDLRFTCPAIAFAEAIRTPAAPVYRYLFSRQTESRNGPRPASHGAELPYVFGSWRNIPLYTPAPVDAALSDSIMATWLGFAATGSPTIPNADASPQGPWPKWSPSGGKTLFLDTEVVAEQDEREARCAAWLELLTGPSLPSRP